MIKICRVCEQEKAIEEMRGHETICKLCANARDKAKRDADPDKKEAKRRAARFQKHKQELLERARTPEERAKQKAIRDTPEYKERAKQYQKKYIENDPEYRKRVYLKSTYGITLEEYKEMLAQQNGVCAICELPELGKNKYLHVDHCHKTGKVRALLCNNCNTGIGQFKENTATMQRAIDYIIRMNNEDGLREIVIQ